MKIKFICGFLVLILLLNVFVPVVVEGVQVQAETTQEKSINEELENNLESDLEQNESKDETNEVIIDEELKNDSKSELEQNINEETAKDKAENNLNTEMIEKETTIPEENAKNELLDSQEYVLDKMHEQAEKLKITEDEVSSELSVKYHSHIQDLGWEKSYSKQDGDISGTTGQNKKIEAIQIQLVNQPANSGIQYQVNVEGIGIQGWKNNGAVAGTTGQNKRVFGIQIKLINLDNYSIIYKVHLQDIGWTDWYQDGQEAKAPNSNKKIEAIQIQIVPKQEKQLLLAYTSHVQDIGWQTEACNGTTSGTIGKNKKIEAIQVELKNASAGQGIRYQAYLETSGWQGWKKNGERAGTVGQNKKVYGFKFELINMPEYSVQYRVHVENVGWLDWKIDGQTAGDVANERKIEAIQIRLITKTSSYPMGVEYYSYRNGKGWEETYSRCDGELSGTVGENRKIEAIKIRLKNVPEGAQIKYKTHIQDIGWENDYHLDGAESGNIGTGKKIEAIRIELVKMPNYTIEYKVHVQDIGWTNWYIDGEIAGTTGQNKKIEAIQIRIVSNYKRNYHGIDVSHHQGLINWEYVKRSGKVDFAIVRVGYGQMSSQKDTQFERNYKGAKEAGIKVGSYLYSYAQSVEDAKKEAYNCLNWLNGRELDYPIFYDLEDKSQEWIDKQTITEMAKTFCNILSQAGYQTGIYANKYWLENRINVKQLPEGYNIWLAHYTYSSSKPSSYKGNYDLWQYTDKGNILGIQTNVDLNVGYKKY